MNGEELAHHLLLDRLTRVDEERRRQSIEHRELLLREIERQDGNIATLERAIKILRADLEKLQRKLLAGCAITLFALVGAGYLEWGDIAKALLKLL